jgi:hypothetical protein
MVKARINGIDCILCYDRRVELRHAPCGYRYVYHLRHSEEDWTRPESIERSVLVNFYGTVFSEEPFRLSDEGYLEISAFETENAYVPFSIQGKVISNMFART